MSHRFLPLKNLRAPTAGSEPTLGARPTGAGDGIDLTQWAIQLGLGPYSTWWIEATLVCTVATSTIAAIAGAPAGSGVELWTYDEDGDGTLRWNLCGYVNGGATIQVVQNMGYKLPLEWVAKARRFALAGTVGGGGTIKYSAIPVEAHWNF